MPVRERALRLRQEGHNVSQVRMAPECFDRDKRITNAVLLGDEPIHIATAGDSGHMYSHSRMQGRSPKTAHFT